MENKMETFYVILRNDGYVFIQRYVPRDYGTVTFKELARFDNVTAAVRFARLEIGQEI